MSLGSIRIPIPPTVLLTFSLSLLLVYAVYLIAPDMAQEPILLIGALLVITIAFTNIEFSLYLLILMTLLSPEITFGGHTQSQLAQHLVNTTQSRGVTLRLDDIMLSLICFTWLFRMAIDKNLGLLRETPINQPIIWYWSISVVATIVGSIDGNIGLYGAFFLIKYLEYFLLFFMIVNHLHDEASIKRLLNVMLFTCMVVSLIGITEIPGGGRVSAPFEGAEGEPNTFGGYLMLMFSVTLGMFLHTSERSKQIRYGVLMGIIIVPFMFTESRSSYLSLAVSLCAFLVYSRRKKLIFSMMLVAILILPAVMPKNVINRIMFTFDQKQQQGQLHVAGLSVDTSTTERLMAWYRVLTIDFPKAPLLGLGVTGGKFLDGQYPRVLDETGLLGFIPFIWLLRRFWVLLRQCYHHVKDTELHGAALGTLCGYAGLLVHAIGANTFIIVRIMEPFMILMGLLLAAMMIKKNRPEAEPSSPLPLGSEVARA
ncbi:MAG: O-antigen ligase family protein [Mariprofundales bacterium]|nr:O-antigen ligase family protein [Mariprofundales bacterium]